MGIELDRLLSEQDAALQRDIVREAHEDEIFTRIAKQHLFIDTLKTRNSDRLDFHDCSVGCIRAALKAAYEAGKKESL